MLTPFASEIYFAASVSKFAGAAFLVFNDLINSANGSSPFSLATVARVRRLGRKGKYKSSSSVFCKQASIFSLSSSVSLPCSAIAFKITDFRSSSSVK